MARFLQLFSIHVEHDYFIGTRAPDWDFVPTNACRQVMQQCGLQLKVEADGVSLWRQTDEIRDPLFAASAHEQDLQLRFQVVCSDPWLNFYTDWPDVPPVFFVNEVPTQDNCLAQLVPLSNKVTGMPDLVAGIGLTQTHFIVEISFPEKALWTADHGRGAICQKYLIRLPAKKIYWKYFFSGGLAGKKVEIVDLDGVNTFLDEAGSKQDGTLFEVSNQTATGADAAWISQTAIPMRQLPQQRFQLREQGTGGKVLLKRLPNANCKMSGKEAGPDGQTRYCAEIYVHQ